MTKPGIREVIVVEGRDDVSAVLRAVDADVLCTHGYGISQRTLEQIKNAYESRGIIIFTDPDHAGAAIRNKLTSEFPGALQAYLTQGEAEKDGDIGIENAAPDAILKALEAAGRTARPKGPEDAGLPVFDDLVALGLAGTPGSAALREAVGARLGTGFANGNAFVKRLQRRGISRRELADAVAAVCAETDGAI